MQWRRCLRQIHERQGAIEVAVGSQGPDDGAGGHLLWRVRLLDVADDELLVEQPMALGRLIPIREGTDMIGVLAIGQNRWMFSTRCLGRLSRTVGPRRTVHALRLVMPDSVERCQRRTHYRVETARLHLPQVDIWPLLDPKSVLMAERANELQFDRDEGRRPAIDDAAERLDFEDIMPEVGPRFAGRLLNLGGGGIGVLVDQSDGAAFQRHKLFWLRVALPPQMHTPICATGKLVHCHMDSTQAFYGGLAFDFTFNPGHQQFVVDQICRYIALQQRMQFGEAA